MTDYREVKRFCDDLVQTSVPGLNGWVRSKCPFCIERTSKADKRGSFGFNIATGGYNCFKCKLHGSIRGYVKDEMLIQRLHKPAERCEKPEDYEPLWTPENIESYTLYPFRKYVKNRGVPQRLWRELQIGACVDGTYFQRVILPVIVGGMWVGWVGRQVIPKSTMPYRNAPGNWKERCFYNQDILDSEEYDNDFIFVVEGIFDAIHLHPYAVAVLGKPSEWHMNELAYCGKKVILLLDGDAWQENEALAMQLKLRGVQAGSIKLPPTKDPDAFTRADLVSLVDICVNKLESIWIE